MHELSLAQNVVDVVTAALPATGGGAVRVVRVNVGELAAVVPDALRFCYEIVTRDTPLAGSELKVRVLPVVIHCATCDRLVELPNIQRFRCPVCETPSTDVRQGKEIEVEAIELAPDGAAELEPEGPGSSQAEPAATAPSDEGRSS